MSFIPVSYWESKTWNKENETKATEKYVPMIMFVLVKFVKMYKSDELNIMVITEWTNGQVAKKSAVKIASIKEQAFEESNIIIISSHAGETFASN